MKITLSPRPDAVAGVAFGAGDRLIVARGDVKNITGNIETPRLSLDLLDPAYALVRFFEHSTLFLKEYRCESGDGEIRIGLLDPGDVECVNLASNETLTIFPPTLLAYTSSVKIGQSWLGVVSHISFPSSFLITAKGPGSVILGANGRIQRKDLQNGVVTIDNDLVVAFSSGIRLKTVLPGGIFAKFSGLGFMARAQGTGFVIYQTGTET